MTVGQAMTCFRETVVTPIGASFLRMQDQAASTTIGEWFELAGGCYIGIAELALFLLVFVFFVRALGRIRQPFSPLSELERVSANRSRKRAAWFFAIASLLTFADIVRNKYFDRFMIGLASAFAVTAVFAIIGGAAWWRTETSIRE